MAGLRRRGQRLDEDEVPVKPIKPRITLETFDLYQKVAQEEQVQTTSGATVSIVSVVICLLLILSELYGFIVPTQREHMVVDRVIEDRLRINFDVTFHALPCTDVNLDAMDVAGEQQNGLDHDITKMRLDLDGNELSRTRTTVEPGADHHDDEHHDTLPPLPADYCGSCYGAEPEGAETTCCNTCDAVRQAYITKGWDPSDVSMRAEQCVRERKMLGLDGAAGAAEGCRLSGFIKVNKVAGNFHVAMGETRTRGAGHIHQFNPMKIGSFNASHTIHTLSFGDPYPGISNPLDGTVKVNLDSSGVHMYYLKVVPTLYHGDTLIKTNQYSATSQFKPAVVQGHRMSVLPGVFFVYDISPFMVTVTEHTTPFAQVLTSTFAILGGVLTIAGLIDSLLYHGMRALRSSNSNNISKGPITQGARP